MTIADSIQTVLLVLVVLQLWVSFRSYRADHERRKKQATFEFVNSVSDRYRSSLSKFDAKHGAGKLVDLSNYDDEDKFFVKSYLNEIERICAGVNAGVFDYAILRKMMSSNLRDSHHRFSQYIKEAQGRNGMLYCEFDEVVKKLASDVEKSYKNVGKISKS